MNFTGRRGGRWTARLAALTVTMLLSGCGLGDAWFGADAPPPLPGTRVAVLQNSRTVEPAPELQDQPVRLPRPEINADWPQAGGLPDHAMGHLELSDSLREAWRTSIGSGSGSRYHLLSTPVIADGRLYALDSDTVVSAYDVKTGRRIWSEDITPDDESDTVVSGNLAYAAGRIYVASGFAEVVSLDAATGKIIWRHGENAPMRAAPTIVGDKVFVVTVENQTVALSINDGRKLWSHDGGSQNAGLLGGSSPAADGTVVIAAYSSGELYALRADTGRVAWNETLVAIRRIDAVSALADIRGLPVIDRNVVFAVSHSGRFAAIDLRTGTRLWDLEIPGQNTPWVAGDYVYILSTTGELYCIVKATGRVRWVTPLPTYENMEKQRDPITWAGPVLGGDRLIVTGTNGQALAVSPYTGEIIGRQKLPDRVLTAPVIADRTLYILTDDARIIALR